MTHAHFGAGAGAGGGGERGTIAGDVTPPLGFGVDVCERLPGGEIDGRCAKLCLPGLVTS